MSERLAGVRLEWEFVEAVADACSPRSTARYQFLLEQARAIQIQSAKQATDSRELTEPSPEAGARAAELVAVQRQSLVLSDKLLLAMERAVELERERNNANQMVLVLLAMVDRLQRNIETLSAERDGRRPTSVRYTTVEEIHERLARSEEQRRTAEAELERARAERSKADRLAEEAAEQLQALKEELETLRQVDPGAQQQPHERKSAVAASEAMQNAIDADADDIDQALAKASRHLDDGANRLVRLADELHQNASDSSDISTDNLLSSNDAVDNLKSVREPGGPSQPGVGGGSASDRTSALQEQEEVLRVYMEKRGHPDLLDSVCDEAKLIPGLVARLRVRNFDNDANEILDFAGRQGPSKAIITCLPALQDSGNDPDAYRIINAAGRDRSSGDLVDLVHALREASLGSQAYQVLTAAGRHRPIHTLLPLLVGLGSLRDSTCVLEAAAKDRSPAACDALAGVLRDAGRPEAHSLEQARARIPTPPTDVPAGQQEDATPYPCAVSSDLPPTELPLLPSPEPSEVNEPLVRPYAMHGGRTQSRFQLPEDALVTALMDESQVQSLDLPEHRRICRLCKQPTSIKRISTVLALPLGVARILVADLADAGLIALNTPASPPAT
ncbi:DUF742 domain-containing protein [Streptomyces sp. WAC01526]|uniref:DUF742 domain-containing protein n=1 Tax=Streptomyces sp. WAC01526 TaxID=2588709 RepID=UPI0021CCC11B|nr:DUF742 domain-containing protein [Streptomyces sp. WAC01526]